MSDTDQRDNARARATGAKAAVDPLEDEDWVPIPSDTDGGRRVLALVVGAVVIVALAIGVLLFWVSRQVNPSGDPGEVVDPIEIPSGSSTDSIAAQLADAGVVTDGGLFARYVGLRGEGPWEAGKYVEFRENSSFDEAIDVLDEGPLPVGASRVRITEGKRLTEALDQIAEQHPNVEVADLLTALGSGEVTSEYLPPGTTNWEGLLFPDTYEFSDDATATEILQTLADQMDDVLGELGYERAETLRGRSAYELLTIASMIERETGSPAEERGQIARVIYNRLEDDEPLGIDATILYGLGRESGELTQSDLEADTPYNTRLNSGLPPTPIGLPARASLEAAIDPPDGDWRYYVLVSNEPPSHLFTESYQEFLDAKDEAQANGVF
ncbi:MAG: endolytic transglycosylase MltG [Microthrixaceae bacterium]